MAATREDSQRRARLAREERDLAQRAARGDRIAFDRLYDRYFARVAWQFRDLPEPHAQAATCEALEQIFAGLRCGAPLAERAYRIARRSSASRTGSGG